MIQRGVNETARSRCVSDDGTFSYGVISGRDWIILALEGELDAFHTYGVRRALLGLTLKRGDRLALDLRGLRFVDSGGIRLILQALQQAESHGADFALVRGPDAVQRVLDLIGLTEQLRVVDHPSLLDEGDQWPGRGRRSTASW
jgi:anti-sigma B factor antagonist